MSRSLNSRKRWKAWTSRLTFSRTGPARSWRVLVFPATLQVRAKYGPWPGWPGLLQQQGDLPQRRYCSTTLPRRISPNCCICLRISARCRSSVSRESVIERPPPRVLLLQDSMVGGSFSSITYNQDAHLFTPCPCDSVAFFCRIIDSHLLRRTDRHVHQ